MICLQSSLKRDREAMEPESPASTWLAPGNALIYNTVDDQCS